MLNKATLVPAQWAAWAASGMLAGLLTACGVPQPADVMPNAISAVAPGPARPHHTPGGFKNNYSDAVSKSFPDLLRWQWAALVNGLPPAPKTPTPTQAPDLPALHANANAGAAMVPSATWIGHASTLVQASGLNVLTDPVFSERASPVQWFGPQRQQPPGVALKDLPPIDVVVISHNHYDHLDRDSVVALDARSKAADPQGQGNTLFLVPLGLKNWLADLGITRVIELDWWAHTHVRGVDFYLTPAQHWSARGATDRSKTLWGGWAVFGPGFTWYFSGDTGYSKDFADTRRFFERQHAAKAPPVQGTSAGAVTTTPPPRTHRFDLALIAIGAYEPRWFMAAQHINPLEAVQVHQDLDAKRSLGIHWGTFNLTDEALDQPPLDLARAREIRGLKPEDFFVLKIGETRRFASPGDN